MLFRLSMRVYSETRVDFSLFSSTLLSLIQVELLRGAIDTHWHVFRVYSYLSSQSDSRVSCLLPLRSLWLRVCVTVRCELVCRFVACLSSPPPLAAPCVRLIAAPCMSVSACASDDS